MNSVEFYKETSPSAIAELVNSSEQLAKFAECVAPKSRTRIRFSEIVVDYIRGMFLRYMNTLSLTLEKMRITFGNLYKSKHSNSNQMNHQPMMQMLL